ncbi:MAG: LPS assembly protein LptD [Phycisphaerae bacterium]
MITESQKWLSPPQGPKPAIAGKPGVVPWRWGRLLVALTAASVPLFAPLLHLQGASYAPITPTVFPILRPSTAINVPLKVAATHTAIWQTPSGTQQMLLTGGVTLYIGYRQLSADSAAVWLKPATSGGEPIFNVSIYLAGHVRVSEGLLGRAVSAAKELLVTTRVIQQVELTGAAPVPKNEALDAVVVRGEALRKQERERPRGVAAIPRIEVQQTEMALGEGWIARGANNVIEPLPKPIFTPGAVASGSPVQHRPGVPPPQIFATGDKIQLQTIGQQRVTIVQGEFFLQRKAFHGQSLELRANDAVLFSPLNSSQPGPAKGQVHSIARTVQGVYLQGDVTITSGDQTIRADRVYYDFTTNRAIMLDAVLSTFDLKAKSPLYMRAAKIVQIAQGDFRAESVKLSTDEFYQPHYYIGAGSMHIRDVSAPTPPGAASQGAVYDYTARNTTMNVDGVPVFYWPYLAGNTQQSNTPLRSATVGFSGIYGAAVKTDWNLFDLIGYTPPKKVQADLNADYFSKRGPGGGINSKWDILNGHGLLHSFIIDDHGNDQLGNDRDNLPLVRSTRGYITARHQQKINDQWTVAVEGSYISDPNFLEQYFDPEYETSSEQQTSLYVEQRHQTEGFTALGKWNLNNFVANADLEDDEYSVQKTPEIKYWRVGDKLFGIFTYYSDSRGGLVNDRFSQYTPAGRGLQDNFPAMDPNATFESYYLARGWTSSNVARFDTRHELDMPLRMGPLEVTPYVVGRATYWSTDFPVTDNQTSGGTTRVWGSAGTRATATFWRVYNNVHSNFFDVHKLRHIVQPEVDVFVSGANVQRGYLQPFDRSVEGITDASGAQFALRQVLQTKRGVPGKRSIVDWITLNVSADVFWNNHNYGPYYAGNPIYAGGPFATSDYGQPLIGYYDFSRPELSQVADSINANFVWRAGANVRFVGDESYNTDLRQLEAFDTGVVVDQSPNLSYFLGNRYVQAIDSDQWTATVNYRLTEKYSFAVTQSYDFALNHNILSALTIVRRLPHFYSGLTMEYNADLRNTSVVISLWPAGFSRYGITSPAALEAVQQ